LCNLLIIENKKYINVFNPNLYNCYSFSPLNFIKRFYLKHPLFATGQQDAIEFLRVLLNDVSIENNNIKTNIPYKILNLNGIKKDEASVLFHNNFISRENSLVINNFIYS
jgi:ubiquitin C-terminal hydrolase